MGEGSARLGERRSEGEDIRVVGAYTILSPLLELLLFFGEQTHASQEPKLIFEQSVRRHTPYDGPLMSHVRCPHAAGLANSLPLPCGSLDLPCSRLPCSRPATPTQRGLAAPPET